MRVRSNENARNEHRQHPEGLTGFSAAVLINSLTKNNYLE